MGTMIPGRRDLAREFNISVPTVQKAIAEMVAEGTLRVEDRRGTFVVFGDPDEKTRNPAVRRSQGGPYRASLTQNSRRPHFDSQSRLDGICREPVGRSDASRVRGCAFRRRFDEQVL